MSLRRVGSVMVFYSFSLCREGSLMKFRYESLYSDLVLILLYFATVRLSISGFPFSDESFQSSVRIMELLYIS